MPLAFGSILGGMSTLIGTPPNLIVAGFREKHTALGAFGMFDFAPVGVPVIVLGVAFIALLGWRLVPARKPAGIEAFETGVYLTEVRVPEDSKAAGKRLYDVERSLDEIGAQVVALVRNEVRLTAPGSRRELRVGDILVIEADADALSKVLSGLGLKLEESKRPEAASADQNTGDNKPPWLADDADSVNEKKKADRKDEAPDEIALIELVILPGSSLGGRSASDILLRTRYGLNLLAVSRQGRRSVARLRSLALRAGDVLLMQGPPNAIMEFASDNGCVPLAERELRIPNRRKAITATAIMLACVSVAAFGLVPTAVAFFGGVLASMALQTVPPRAVYDAIDWPVIVLLAALIPVAGAMESTGTADLVARVLLEGVARGHAVVALSLIMIVTMFLSDLMNNAATAAVMCPVAISTAMALGVDVDAFLMAVAIGASCAFLTPIGHQNNTLILGPSGFRFGDYWLLGLPLELIVLVVAVPMLLWVWPL